MARDALMVEGFKALTVNCNISGLGPLLYVIPHLSLSPLISCHLSAVTVKLRHEKNAPEQTNRNNDGRGDPKNH